MTERLRGGQIAQMACLLELTARKAGNVHRFVDFNDASFLDFALSAQAVGPALDQAVTQGLGLTILKAVEATRQVTATNTNLGMILLLAPLAMVVDVTPIRKGLSDLLRSTTVEDCRLVYQAIRLANPGAIGKVPEQDIAEPPTSTLLEAMTIAADRDLIAKQYTNQYAEVFEVAIPALQETLSRSQSLETAIVHAHLSLLARHPDSLIARKRGRVEATEASRRASEVLLAGWPDQKSGQTAFITFDQWLRSEKHERNPGTTADLIAAALFVTLCDGTIKLPLARPNSLAFGLF